MLNSILKSSTKDIDDNYIKYIMNKLKNSHPEMYEDELLNLYVLVNGYHFNEDLVKRATSKMINEDGSTGCHWDIDKTTTLGNANGAKFGTEYNKYDFNYVMNMLYSDLYNSVDGTDKDYAKMAVKWLDDKDAQKGKALRYYIAISKK